MTPATLQRLRDLYTCWAGFDPLNAGFTPADALDDLRRMRAHIQNNGEQND